MEPGLTLLLVVLQNVVFLVVTVGVFWAVILVMRAFGRRKSFSLSPLGFARPANGLWRGLGLGLAVGVGALVVSFPLSALSAYFLELLGYQADRNVQQPLMRGVESLVAQRPLVAIPAAFLVIAVIGPAVEELVFRGAIFGGLYNLGRFVTGKTARIGGATAFVVSAGLSSALFASLHLEPAIIPAIFVLAFSLCWLLRRTGSLLPPFVAHATFNSFTTALLVLAGLGVIPSPA